MAKTIPQHKLRFNLEFVANSDWNHATQPNHCWLPSRLGVTPRWFGSKEKVENSIEKLKREKKADEWGVEDSIIALTLALSGLLLSSPMLLERLWYLGVTVKGRRSIKYNSYDIFWKQNQISVAYFITGLNNGLINWLKEWKDAKFIKLTISIFELEMAGFFSKIVIFQSDGDFIVLIN